MRTETTENPGSYSIRRGEKGEGYGTQVTHSAGPPGSACTTGAEWAGARSSTEDSAS